MLLHELFEAETKHVTFCFGRMNPPTIGHKQVLDTMKSQGGEMKIFVSQSQDKKKNPLDYGTKIKFIKEMFPQYAKDVVENAALNTIGKVASYLHEQGYNAVTFVAGSDRIEDMKSLLTQYNGVEGKAHGFYKFDVIDFASSGDREDGAEGVAGVSASGARAAAANNDFEGFQEATGAGELSKPLFAAVRKGMGIKGEVEEDISRRGFLRGAGALATGAALGATGANAQTSGEDYLPDIVAHVKFKVNGKEISKDINLGTQYKSPREAAEALEKFLRSKGIKYFEYDLERVKPKDDDYMDKTPYSKTNAVGEAISLDKLRSAGSPETQSNKDLSARLKQGMSSKPRNFVAKNAISSGAGQHKDKKRAEKQGDVKHKAKQYEQGVAEGLGLYGPFTVTINTGERPQSRTKTKKFRREDDAILWAEDWLEDAPQYVFATAEVTDPDGNVVWTTDEQGMAEETVNELSNQLLGRYKKAAGADASAADKAGDFERGNKRFKGIVKATIKQGDNDSKKHKEQGKS